MPHARFIHHRTRRSVLRQHESLVLDNAEGTIIAVDRGCLWVTLEHDTRDVVLVKGMRFEVDRAGRTIVAAEADSTLRLLSPVTLQERLSTWLRRGVAKLRSRWTNGLARRMAPYY